MPPTSQEVHPKTFWDFLDGLSVYPTPLHAHRPFSLARTYRSRPLLPDNFVHEQSNALYTISIVFNSTDLRTMPSWLIMVKSTLQIMSPFLPQIVLESCNIWVALVVVLQAAVTAHENQVMSWCFCYYYCAHQTNNNFNTQRVQPQPVLMQQQCFWMGRIVNISWGDKMRWVIL